MAIDNFYYFKLEHAVFGVGVSWDAFPFPLINFFNYLLSKVFTKYS